MSFTDEFFFFICLLYLLHSLCLMGNVERNNLCHSLKDYSSQLLTWSVRCSIQGISTERIYSIHSGMLFQFLQPGCWSLIWPSSNSPMARNWFATLNTSKTNLVTFHHYRDDSEFSSGCTSSEATYFRRILGLKITPDIKYTSYIRSIAKDARKILGSFVPPAML